MRVTREFKFDAAHHLDGYKGACANLHGHSWRFSVTLEGKINDIGMVIDFKKMKSLIHGCVVSRLDHQYLNNVFHFNPTAEYLAIWIFREVQKTLDALLDENDKKLNIKVVKVVLWENYPECYVEYSGD
jgi:6-pyruvoyltetrahydropterin/6-carboxytetrahydropterin synthase